MVRPRALLIGWACCAAACADAPRDPRALPWRAEPVRDFQADAVSVDLDGDGYDEVVSQYVPSRKGPLEMRAVLIQRHDGSIIEQANFDGFVLPAHALDINRDRRPEILVPFVRHDSLFATFLDGDGRKLHTFFLIGGSPRIEPDGVLPWDPVIVNAWAVDVNGDGSDELVTVVNTAYARLPRGVLVHSLPEGRPLGSAIVGSHIHQAVLDDFDGDGRFEVRTLGSGVNNGARAGGMDDSRPYLVAFELGAPPRTAWWREAGGVWTFSGLGLVSASRSGHEIVVIAAAVSGQSRIQVIESRSGRVLRERVEHAGLVRPVVIDIDGDGRVEVAAIRPPDEIWLFDTNLDVKRRRRVANNLAFLQRAADVDGDHADDLVVIRAAGAGGHLLLGPDLRVRAVLEPGPVQAVVRRGALEPPLMLIARDAATHGVQLVRQPAYLLFRYGPAGLATGMTVTLLGLLVALFTLRRRSRMLAALQAARSSPLEAGWILLDRRGRIRLAGAPDDLLPRDTKAGSLRTLKDIATRSPALAEFCSEIIHNPSPHGVRDRTIEAGADGASPLRVLASRVVVGSRNDPHWLVSWSARRGILDPDVASAWFDMALQLAHDIKNPLSAIRVKLKSLQRELGNGPPGTAAVLDRYTADIEGRIEHLRRTTSSFMKFVDIDRPRRVRTDLNAFLAREATTIAAGLPPDVQVVLNLDQAVLPVAIDADQIHSVLENLIANAFQAMPDGGRITIATAPAAAGIEVRVSDSGPGIPAADLPRVFEPRFSTRRDGSGLGLAIVRKIIQDHGGEISAHCPARGGTTFRLVLPATGMAAEAGNGTRVSTASVAD